MVIEDNKIVDVCPINIQIFFKTKHVTVLFAHSLVGIISHPFTWFIESYYKIGLYKNVKSKVNIVTLFVIMNIKIKKLAMYW